jgi:hypothetical protein
MGPSRFKFTEGLPFQVDQFPGGSPLGVYLEITTHFLREGLIDWSGLEEMKPVIRAVLERVRSGEMTLEEFQASINRSCRDHMG